MEQEKKSRVPLMGENDSDYLPNRDSKPLVVAPVGKWNEAEN